MGDTGLEHPPQNTGETLNSHHSGPTGGPTETSAGLAAALQALAALSSEQLAGLLNLSQVAAGK